MESKESTNQDSQIMLIIDVGKGMLLRVENLMLKREQRKM